MERVILLTRSKYLAFVYLNDVFLITVSFSLAKGSYIMIRIYELIFIHKYLPNFLYISRRKCFKLIKLGNLRIILIASCLSCELIISTSMRQVFFSFLWAIFMRRVRKMNNLARRNFTERKVTWWKNVFRAGITSADLCSLLSLINSQCYKILIISLREYWAYIYNCYPQYWLWT